MDLELARGGTRGGRQPVAVRRPGKGQVVVVVGEQQPVAEHGRRLARLPVEDADLRAIVEEGDALPVRRVGRLQQVGIAADQFLLDNRARRREGTRAVPADGRLEDVPVAVTLGREQDRPGRPARN